MDIVEIDKKITDIEVKYREDIFALNFLGFNIWPVFRLLHTYKNLPKSKSAGPSHVRWFLDLPALIKLIVTKRNRIAIRVSSANYHTQSVNNKVSARINTVVDAVGRENVIILGTLKQDEGQYYLQKRLIPNIDLPINFIRKLVPYIRILLRPFGKSFIRKKTLHFKRLQIDPDQAISIFTKFLCEFCLFYLLYGLIRPKNVIFMTGSYGNEGEIMALKKLKRPVFEYEHGYTWPEQVGYSYNKCLRPLKNKMVIPEKYLCFGEYWKDIFIQKGFYYNDDVEVVGNPSLAGSKRMSKLANNVLITTQPGYSQQFHRFLENYLQKSKYADDKLFIVKCHPRESRYDFDKWVEFSKKFPGKIKISTDDTMELLNKCTVLVSGTSTTLFEGLYFQCTNYIMTNDFGKYKSAMWRPEFGKLIDEHYTGKLSSRKMSKKLDQIVFDMWPPFSKEELRKCLIA